jgi:hypothetical protein
MKRIFGILAFFLLSQGVFAAGLEGALDAYLSFQDDVKAAAAETSATRSTARVIIEGYVVSSTRGLVSASNDTINGPLTRLALRSITAPLYEDGEFGLYLYKGYKVQVWFEGDFASVITMMAYTAQ